MHRPTKTRNRRAAEMALWVVTALLMVSTEPATAAPPGAVPFFCSRSVGVGFEQPVSCRRADTRASFTSVPEGLFFHVTDIHITRNNAATTGYFAALIGRDDVSDFPTYPRIDFTGEAIGVNALHFTTPYIILRAGETLSVANFASSELSIDVYISGYLATTVAP